MNPTIQFQLQILGKVGIAIFLGAFIGFDREAAEKPAGLRTHMLVSGAAALIVSLSNVMVTHINLQQGSELIGTDPIRIIQAVITGVSFLGAGTIIRSSRSKHIEGVTTAASILFSVSVGIAVALTQFVLAFGATLLAVLTLRVVGWIRHRITHGKNQRED
jgi:putative Mg2+ transporter-C (MgtC) family protein